MIYFTNKIVKLIVLIAIESFIIQSCATIRSDLSGQLLTCIEPNKTFALVEENHLD